MELEANEVHKSLECVAHADALQQLTTSRCDYSDAARLTGGEWKGGVRRSGDFYGGLVCCWRLRHSCTYPCSPARSLSLRSRHSGFRARRSRSGTNARQRLAMAKIGAAHMRIGKRPAAALSPGAFTLTSGSSRTDH